MGILPSCRQVEQLGIKQNASMKKIRWEPYKDDVCCFQQILEAELYKIATVRLLPFHQPSK